MKIFGAILLITYLANEVDGACIDAAGSGQCSQKYVESVMYTSYSQLCTAIGQTKCQKYCNKCPVATCLSELQIGCDYDGCEWMDSGRKAECPLTCSGQCLEECNKEKLKGCDTMDFLYSTKAEKDKCPFTAKVQCEGTCHHENMRGGCNFKLGSDCNQWGFCTRTCAGECPAWCGKVMDENILVDEESKEWFVKSGVSCTDLGNEPCFVNGEQVLDNTITRVYVNRGCTMTLYDGTLFSSTTNQVFPGQRYTQGLNTVYEIVSSFICSCLQVTCERESMTIHNVNGGFMSGIYIKFPSTCTTLTSRVYATPSFTLNYRDNTDCLASGSNIITAGSVEAAGDLVTVKFTYMPSGGNMKTGIDEDSTATCRYAFTPTGDIVMSTPIEAVRLNGADAYNPVDQSTFGQEAYNIEAGASLKMYKKTDNLLLSSTTFDFNRDVVCATVKLDANSNIAIKDLNIRKFEFLRDEQASDTILYMQEYCVQTNTKIQLLMEDHAAFVNLCATSNIINCPKQRTICFTPFVWADQSALYVRLTVTPETDTGYRGGLTSCGENHNIGRKKRESELDDIKDFTMGIQIPLMRKDEAILTEDKIKKMQQCDSSIYVITSIVFGAAFILMFIIVCVVFAGKRRRKTHPREEEHITYIVKKRPETTSN